MEREDKREDRNKRRKKRLQKKTSGSRRILAGFLILVMILILAGTAYWILREAGAENVQEETSEGKAEPEVQLNPPAIETANTALDLSGVYSEAGILVRLSDGKVFAEFQSQEQIYPASLTKMMTCLVAIERITDLEEKITLEPEIFPALYEEGASMAGFEPGETVTVRDLLYGIILPSGGECSVEIARHVAGSEDAFVEMMNEKAAELGMTDTHFMNVTGLQDEEHYTTVKDMSILLQNALENRLFRQIFCTREYTASPTEQHPQGLSFGSSMFRLAEDWQVNGGEIRGGKTGFTDQAGLCLASLAHVDNRDYILVTAKADGNHQTEPYHALDALNLYGQIRKEAPESLKITIEEGTGK